MLAGEICVVNREFSDLQWLMNTMYSAFKTTPVHCLLEFFFFLGTSQTELLNNDSAWSKMFGVNFRNFSLKVTIKYLAFVLYTKFSSPQKEG